MKIHLKNVRISFPSLFQRSKFNGVEGKYQAKFLINKEKDATLVNTIKSEIALLIKESGIKIADDKLFLKDAKESDCEDFENFYVVSASTATRPLVINRDKSPIIADDNIIYGGCYVNAVVSMWVQNNQYGKRINAGLEGVQFVKEGEPFGAKRASVSDFDILDEAASGDDDLGL